MSGCPGAFFGNNRGAQAVKTNMNSLLLGTALVVGSGACCAAAPAPALRDLNGVLRRPLAAQGARGVVLVFIADDCPISNSYAPEISRLAARCAAKGVAFTLVNTDTQVSADQVKKHGMEYGLTCRTLLDPGHLLTKYAGATATPEAVILCAERDAGIPGAHRQPVCGLRESASAGDHARSAGRSGCVFGTQSRHQSRNQAGRVLYLKRMQHTGLKPHADITEPTGVG